FRVHLSNELFVRHPRTPFLSRLEHDGGVIHIKWRVVGGTVGSTDCTEHALDFWKGPEDSVLLLQELRGLRDGNTGKRRGHVQRRAFKQGWHELTAQFEHQGKRQQEEYQIEQQCRLAESQAESQYGQIDCLRNS